MGKLAGSMWRINKSSMVVPLQPVEDADAYWFGYAELDEGDTVIILGEPVPTVDSDPAKKHHSYVPVEFRNGYAPFFGWRNGYVSNYKGYMNATYCICESIWMERVG